MSIFLKKPESSDIFTCNNDLNVLNILNNAKRMFNLLIFNQIYQFNNDLKIHRIQIHQPTVFSLINLIYLIIHPYNLVDVISSYYLENMSSICDCFINKTFIYLIKSLDVLSFFTVIKGSSCSFKISVFMNY